MKYMTSYVMHPFDHHVASAGLPLAHYFFTNVYSKLTIHVKTECRLTPVFSFKMLLWKS